MTPERIAEIRGLLAEWAAPMDATDPVEWARQPLMRAVAIGIVAAPLLREVVDEVERLQTVLDEWAGYVEDVMSLSSCHALSAYERRERAINALHQP